MDHAVSSTFLVRRAKLGDQTAADLLVERFKGLAVWVAKDYYLPDGTLDDLVAEALLGFAKAIQDWRPDGGSGFNRFAELCIRRQVVTAVKAATRIKHRAFLETVRTATDLDGNELPAVDLLMDGETTDEMFERREQVMSLARLIRERLTETECGALIGLLNGLTYEEMSARLEVTEKSIDNALARARDKLNGSGRYSEARPPGEVFYRCPSCGGATRKRPGRGRPPRCVVCRVRRQVSLFAA